jgi:hypothetical protein
MTQGGLPLVAAQRAVAYTGVHGVVDGNNKPSANIGRFSLAVARSSISSQEFAPVLELYPQPVNLEHVYDSIIPNRDPGCAYDFEPSIESASELCTRPITPRAPM